MTNKNCSFVIFRIHWEFILIFFLLQFYLYYRNLINWCNLIFSFHFSCFLSFHLDTLTHFIKYGYSPILLAFSNFVMGTGLITKSIYFVQSFGNDILVVQPYQHSVVFDNLFLSCSFIIIIIIILILVNLSYQRYMEVFHWSLSDNKSPLISWTLLSILTELNNVSLDGLDSYSDFHFHQSFFWAFFDSSSRTNYNWYHCHSDVYSFFVL